MAKRVVLPHFRERVDESPQQDENFGTFGLFLSFFVSELRPFKVKDKFFQCIFEALFINSANALLLTAVNYQVYIFQDEIFSCGHGMGDDQCGPCTGFF